MAHRSENIAFIEAYYACLASGDFEALADMHSDDVAFNMLGSTPVSGRWEGKAECFGPLVADGVVGKLVPDKFAFARKWKIMCGDDQRVVGIMQGGGPGLNGEQYDQTYGQIFTIGTRDGALKIVELHEFYDTALVELVLNDNPTEKGVSTTQREFQY
ncbi:nuclear transport factor 2 family protein [Parasphingorhabdus sp.]|jgi:ketosteroid isomerase-like protein|uniref:nuclear transport factor 2 family protein n=1 Tax=Parasphingorhabdus sp. TaxID=2709688 RepID=UPI003D295D9F